VVPAFERMAGGPPDVIFECVGTKGLIQECLSIAAARTQVVVVGVCMEPDVILPFVGMAKEITLKFVIAYVAMIEQGRIASDAMVTHVVGFDEFSDAFEALKRPSDQCKVCSSPGTHPFPTRVAELRRGPQKGPLPREATRVPSRRPRAPSARPSRLRPR
jgi:threonine dehydrogenase-like Zn-dependent dehydrogenase